MKEETHHILLDKYIRSDCSPAERSTVEAWIKESDANREEYEQFKQLNDELLQFDFGLSAQTDQQWENLKAQLQVAETSTDDATVVPITRARRFRFLRVAAAVALLLSAAWLVNSYFNAPNAPTLAQEFITPLGQTQSIELADGSTILLNADSKLFVKEGFNGEDRQVELQGQAYFQIAKNPNKPFIIQTGEVRTQVLGTAFSLKAYPDDPSVHIAVSEGKVKFFENESNSIELTAEKAATFDRDDKAITATEFDAESSFSWKENRLSFSKTPFKEVVRTLERKYGVKIVDKTGDNFKELLSTSYESTTPLADILHELNLVYSLKITRKGEEIHISL